MLLQRFQAEAGLAIVRLPLGTPPGQPHVPILVSSSSRGPLLARKKRIVLVVNEAVQDLGVFAYRIVGGEGKGAISRGSALELAKLLPEYRAVAANDDGDVVGGSMTNRGSKHQAKAVDDSKDKVNNDGVDDDDDDTPGLVVTNPGQLLWWRGGQEAVTFRTWGSLPRATAVHGPMRIDEARNRVPGQRSATEHLRYVFEEVLGAGGAGGIAVAPDARIYVIAVADGAGDAVAYLNENCTRLSSLSLSLSLFSIYLSLCPFPLSFFFFSHSSREKPTAISVC
jgi:hypothetical protein